MDIEETILELIAKNKTERLQNRLYGVDEYYTIYADGYNDALNDLLAILKSSMMNL